MKCGLHSRLNVALNSLAAHMSAPVEEIRKLAADGELGRLFTRTGGGPPVNTFGRG
jgi:hypothetical protein